MCVDQSYSLALSFPSPPPPPIQGLPVVNVRGRLGCKCVSTGQALDSRDSGVHQRPPHRYDQEDLLSLETPGVTQGPRIHSGCTYFQIKGHLTWLHSFLAGKLESVLRSRYITLSTMGHIVRAMVFPVVKYGCESWAIKKAEHQRIDAFKLGCWRRLLKVLWMARR